MIGVMVHQDGWIARAYRYALDPTSAQVKALESHCGAARFAYNHMLTWVSAVMDPRPLRAAQARLCRLQRRAARRRGPWDSNAAAQRTPSRRWRQARAKIAKTHARVANLRRNAIHHATTELVRKHDVLVVEHLNLAGMNRRGGHRKRGLNRAIGDAALGRVRAMLEYKADWSGRTVLSADRHYPSSQLCSGCGARTKLPLSERTYRCRPCGLVIDRDLNAAINLARLGALPHRGERTGTGSSPAASVPAGKGRGAVRKTSSALTAEKAGGYEASTRPDVVSGRHRTGTAAS